MDNNPEIRDRLNVNKPTYITTNDFVNALSASSEEPSG